MAEPKNIDEALLAFQAEPVVLTKDKKGQAGNQKTKYADLVQAYEIVLPRLTALGVVWKTKPTVTADGKFLLAWELKHVPSGTVEIGEWPLRVTDNPQQQGSLVSYGRRYALLTVLNVAAEDEDDDGDAGTGRQYAQRAAQQSRRQRPADEPDAGGRTAQRRAQPARGPRPALPGEDPDGPVGQDQHRHMHALWRELGAGGDDKRDFRLKKTAEWLGLAELDSSANLTRGQADAVISCLRQTKDARAAKAATAGGGEPE